VRRQARPNRRRAGRTTPRQRAADGTAWAERPEQPAPPRKARACCAERPHSGFGRAEAQ
jgi:hypothetical protein